MAKVVHTISVALLPADPATAPALRAAVHAICAADPMLGITVGPENETILWGQSELQFDFVVDALRRGKGLRCNVGAPQVQYREIITRTFVSDYTHKRQTGGSDEYAKVRIRFEPGARESGFVFANAVRDGAIPDAFIPDVEKGLMSAKEIGVIAGFPVMDIKCILLDGACHDVESARRALEIAARTCFREAMPKAGPRLMEPIMKVVATPEDYIGDVVGDLNIRRGQITGMEPRDGLQAITAFVPLANLLGYLAALSHMTQGRANCTMTYAHYEQVPPAVGMRA